ncbi:MAG: septum formation inhibitor Maf [Actinomycetota bacterium]
MSQLVLASTSPARRKILTDAGIRFTTVNPEVDEEALVAAAQPPNTEAMVSLLAVEKARAGLERWRQNSDVSADLILGCDSALEMDGQSYGKPLQAEVAIDRWRQLRGAEGWLVTGHSLTAISSGRSVSRVTRTLVRFQSVSDAEILAYVATGEPLQVAGGFTIDGLGGAFIREIEGDYHTVVGLSLVALREMVLELGVDYHALWD